MDNTQLSAPDGSWFLFADWQGVTRIALPGDKVKTDANLDRPNEVRPLVLRPNGLVWSAYALDIDPVSLKKSQPDDPGHESPDPLGGPDIAVGYAADVTVHGETLSLVLEGDELRLGGREGRRQQFIPPMYDVRPDGAVVFLGPVNKATCAGLVLREDDGAGRPAWCRPIALVLNGSPDLFRDRGTTFIGDRDLVEGVAYLVEISDAGEVVSEQSTPAVAGPWVHDGEVWWQPDDASVCAGPRLGEVADRFALPEAHRGPGRLLRLAGRKLFLAAHGVTILDFAPAKKGKSEISRKHKAKDEPMYREAARLLQPIADAMARRGVRMRWRGCVRSGKRIEPMLEITGPASVLTDLVGYALETGGRARLASVGVTSIDFNGGASSAVLSGPVTTADDIHELIALFDSVGLARGVGFPQLTWLWEMAAKRELPLPITADAEDLMLAAVLSGLRGETSGPIRPVGVDDLATVAPRLREFEVCRAAGIDNARAALFIAIMGHRRFGEAAVASLTSELRELNLIRARDLDEALGRPVQPYVAPIVTEPELDAQEAARVAALEAVLTELDIDPAASRESLRWYRFSIDGAPFQAGLHDDFRVSATLCATPTDLDLRALANSLAAANEQIAGARFLEADCYIHVRATCPFADVSVETVAGMVRACQDALASGAGQELRANYRAIG